MTREEKILNEAIDYSFIEDNYIEYDDCGDVCDDKDFIQKAFESGAKWADKHPNLYNDEKYHTVKVSCLDELNRKSVLYDEFLEKACEYLKTHLFETVDADNDPIVESVHNITLDNFIKDFKIYLGE